MNWIYFLSWLAVFFTSTSYWFQIVKIQIHKEVRDISVGFILFQGTGTLLLGLEAIEEHSEIFIAKQLMTLIPVCVLMLQLALFRNRTWHEAKAVHCQKCEEELERRWSHCPNCGAIRPLST